MKKKLIILGALCLMAAVGVCAAGTAGLWCVFTFLSCFADGDPGRYPVTFPVSILGGTVCLALFVFLICCYVRLRAKAPSVLWAVVDVIAAAALVWPFWEMWKQIAQIIR